MSRRNGWWLALGLIVGASAFVLWLAIRRHDLPARGGERVPAAQSEPPQASGARRENVIALDRGAQARIGLQTKVLAAAQLAPEVKAYGRVLDPTPLLTLAAEVSAAQAASAASSAEYERLRVLHQEDRNASARAVQDAEALARRDRIAVESARARLALSWGNVLAEDDHLPELMRSLIALESLLVRVDLPAGEAVAGEPTAVRLSSVVEERWEDAELLSPAPTVDPLVQGRGFLVLAKGGSLRLRPGSSVMAMLALAGAPQGGVVVPRTAVVRAFGAGWVYVQVGDEEFSRRLIALEYPTQDGWFVTSDFTPGDNVVVAGAQMLLSEELKRQFETEGD